DACSIDACSYRGVVEIACVLAATGGARSRGVGALADDRRVERDAHRVLVIAGSCCDGADRGPMPIAVTHSAIACDIAARGIDSTCELVEIGIDAGVDD